MSAVDSLSFRRLMGLFPTGIVVAAVQDKTLGAVGITINSLTSVSLKPPLILFCLDKQAHLHPVFRRNDVFAINFLSTEQKDISQHFANYSRYPEPKGMWDKPQQGCPLLRRTLGWGICRKTKTVSGGDHSIFLAEITHMQVRKNAPAPLIYYQGQYRNLKV